MRNMSLQQVVSCNKTAIRLIKVDSSVDIILNLPSAFDMEAEKEVQEVRCNIIFSLISSPH